MQSDFYSSSHIPPHNSKATTVCSFYFYMFEYVPSTAASSMTQAGRLHIIVPLCPHWVSFFFFTFFQKTEGWMRTWVIGTDANVDKASDLGFFFVGSSVHCLIRVVELEFLSSFSFFQLKITRFVQLTLPCFLFSFHNSEIWAQVRITGWSCLKVNRTILFGPADPKTADTFPDTQTA